MIMSVYRNIEIMTYKFCQKVELIVISKKIQLNKCSTIYNLINDFKYSLSSIGMYCNIDCKSAFFSFDIGLKETDFDSGKTNF